MTVVADPINKKIVEFYAKYGFEQLPDSKKLFLPMKKAVNLTAAIASRWLRRLCFSNLMFRLLPFSI